MYSSDDETAEDDDFSNMQKSASAKSMVDSWCNGKKRRHQEFVSDTCKAKLPIEAKNMKPFNIRATQVDQGVQHRKRNPSRGKCELSLTNRENNDRVLKDIVDDPVLSRAKADRK